MRWAGRKVAESLSTRLGKAAWRRQHRKLWGRRGFPRRPLPGWTSERWSWPPSLRLGKSYSHGIKSKIVQKTPGRNGEDPTGVGTQVQSQGLKPRVS